MLRNTFVHIPGIGEVTERRVWESGILTWRDFIAAAPARPPRGLHRDQVLPEVERSEERFAACDWTYFDQRLPANQKWRAFGELADQALYVDIETSGMGEQSRITVIGTYDGRETKAFIEGVNLEKAVDELEAHPLVITFNGAQFDLPIIRSRFRYNAFNFIHVDLRFPLRRLGLRGGLKSIERQLRITRNEATQGLDGWDAVRLWREYEEGHSDALDLLVAYNREDIAHLKALMEFVYREHRRLLTPPTAIAI